MDIFHLKTSHVFSFPIQSRWPSKFQHFTRKPYLMTVKVKIKSSNYIHNLFFGVSQTALILGQLATTFYSSPFIIVLYCGQEMARGSRDIPPLNPDGTSSNDQLAFPDLIETAEVTSLHSFPDDPEPILSFVWVYRFCNVITIILRG